MIAVARAMLIGLLRDRGALAMAFVLPPVIFVIFATIFAGATGADLRLKVAIADSVGSDTTRRLVAALIDAPTLDVAGGAAMPADAVRRRVREGGADAGIVIRADPAGATAGGPPPIVVIGEPSRAIASPVVDAALRRILADALPEVALGRMIETIGRDVVRFTPEQDRRIAAALGALRDARVTGLAPAAPDDGLVAHQPVRAAAPASGNVTYYAGAVAILFLLFAAVQAAGSLLDERELGIVDRIDVLAGGTWPVVAGKFLYLAGFGFVQCVALFAVAWLGYGVDVPGRAGGWALVSLAAAIAAGGLALGLVALCRTRAQAHTAGTFLVLVVSALGGSMVPRFLMPGWLQDLGWATPNAWAIEAYGDLLWRDAPFAAVLPALAVLAAAGAAGAALAALALARRQRR
ncbi:MAG: ABC transporter permease [Rhodospirillales bacterium]